MNKKLTILRLFLAFLNFGMVGCSAIHTSNEKFRNNNIGNQPNEALVVGGGAVAGAAVGYAINKKTPWTSMGGAASGGILMASILNKHKQSMQQGFDMGYVQGNADAIKRHYWMCQNLHKEPKNCEKVVYLSIPAPTVTEDGRKLVPRNVMVPIVE